MDKKQIDRFFRAFNQNIKIPVADGKIKIILTGAAAGTILGGNRPSIDIDFEISCDKEIFKDAENAVRRASDVTGIAVNFSEDIDRWSQITFLDYRKHTIAYKTFGRIAVFILSPAYWSIGKIARYLDPDVDDLVKVLKNNPVEPLELVRLWSRALAKSPRSTASFTFKRHAEHFLRTYGATIWEKGFDPENCLKALSKVVR